MAAVVAAPPPTKVVEKRQALAVEQTALANVPPPPPPTPARPIVTSEDRTIPLLADAVLPDAGAKHAVPSAPSGRFERGTDAGLRRVDTVALQSTAARGTEITVVQRDGVPTQPKTVEKAKKKRQIATKKSPKLPKPATKAFWVKAMPVYRGF